MISIIVPVFNVAPYLRQCLESILAQTYRDLDVIVVDDGSTDRCGQICDEYACRDDRVRVWHTENRGLSSARNLGLDQARGTYISFIDSDDWIEPDAMETLLSAMIQADADIAVGGRCKEYADGSRSQQKTSDTVQVFHGQDILSAYAAGKFRDAMWNKLYHAGCFDGIRFPDGRNYEDVATTWRLMKSLAENGGKIAVVPKTLFHFRMRKSSISHTKTYGNIVDLWKACMERYTALAAFQDSLLPFCLYSIAHMWLHYSSFSKDDKLRAAETIQEMQSFSKSHFHHVMEGKYSVSVKSVCFLSRSKAPLVMWLCCCGGKLLSAIKKNKRKMYD